MPCLGLMTSTARFIQGPLVTLGTAVCFCWLKYTRDFQICRANKLLPLFEYEDPGVCDGLKQHQTICAVQVQLQAYLSFGLIGVMGWSPFIRQSINISFHPHIQICTESYRTPGRDKISQSQPQINGQISVYFQCMLKKSCDKEVNTSTVLQTFSDFCFPIVLAPSFTTFYLKCP